MNDLSPFNSENNNLPMSTQWALKKQGSEEIKNVMLAKLHEDGRGYITQAALENAGMLSSLNQHLCQVAPQGAAHYEHILQAYTIGAAKKIARW